jgi:hypothetical protein
MPLPMVHLAVAHALIESGSYFAVENLPSFYLGTIAPDAIHMRANLDRAAKNLTHIIEPDKRPPKSNPAAFYDYVFSAVNDFMNSNQDSANVDFLRGYCVHILTDQIWGLQIFTPFRDKFNSEPSQNQNLNKVYYNNTGIVDNFLYNECEWRKGVWKLLESVKACDFLNLLTAGEICEWNERTLHWYDPRDNGAVNSARYITKTKIMKFISDCSELIIDHCK